MSHENAQLLYKAAQEAQQKFEYFLTGAIGAMFAYVVQTYTPQELDFSASTLEPISLVFFAVAFFLGLRRINFLYHMLGIGYEQAQASADAKEIEKALRQAEPYKETLSPQQDNYRKEWEMKRDWSRKRADSANPILEELDRKARLFYSCRNHLLIGGFVAMALARILEPYAK